MDGIHDPENLTGMAAILVGEDPEINVRKLEDAAKLGLDDSASVSGDIDYTTMLNDKIQQADRYYNTAQAPHAHCETPGEFAQHIPQVHPISPAVAPMDDESGYQYGAEIELNDEQIHRMTEEERHQTHLNRAIDIESDNGEMELLQTREDEDDRALMLERIDALRQSLNADEVDLSNIIRVGPDTNRRTVKTVMRTLQIMNDRAIYRDMFNETVVMGAYGLEVLFDGEREWFGSKVNLTGWSRRVNIKLRQMNYETSTLVGELMNGYNLGPGARIVMALVPSLFLHSRDKRNKTNNGIDSSAAYVNAMEDLTARENRKNY